MAPRPAVFLDRDGVLIVDKGYVHKISDIEVFADVPEGLARLQDLGFHLLVITNQSGIARGYFTLDQVHSCHRHFNQLLQPTGTQIDKFYICPHHPKGVVAEYSISCNCRKPEPGLVLEGLSDFSIDPQASFVIGDKSSDVDCGQRLGLSSIQIDRGQYPLHPKPDFLAKSFSAAVSFIEDHTLKVRQHSQNEH